MANQLSDTAKDISSVSSKKKHIILACSISAAVLVLAVGAAVFFHFYTQNQATSKMNSLVDASTFYKGIVVQGVDLGGKTMKQATDTMKALEPSLRDKYDITITYKDKSWKLTENDFKFTFDTDQVLKEAYSYARTGSHEERYKLISKLATTPKTYQISHTMTYNDLKAKLTDMVKGIAVAPIDATVASFDTSTATFSYKDGKDGLSVDENKLYEDVVKIINGPKTGKVELSTATVPFNVTTAQMKSHMQKLGTYSTYSINNANGNHNMALALSKANGVAVAPGATFSFNETTGNSTNASSGYLKAGAISGGKHIEEYGGGICQASTTIYGAAIRSNMEIVARSNHLWVSTYCPIGLDATISYPYLDFKFKNPTQYPVYIVAGMSGTKLTVTFYGYQSPDYDTIQVTSKQTESIPMPAPVYKTDNSLAPGTKKLDVTGNGGKRATAQRIFYKNGSVVKTEALPSSYYSPVAPVYLVGPAAAPAPTPTPTPPASSAPAPTTPAPTAPAAPASPATPAPAKPAQ